MSHAVSQFKRPPCRHLPVHLVQCGAQETVPGIKELVQACAEFGVVGDEGGHLFGEVAAPGGNPGAFIRQVMVAGVVQDVRDGVVVAAEKVQDLACGEACVAAVFLGLQEGLLVGACRETVP